MKFQLYENLNPLQVGTRLPKYLKTAPLPKLDNDKKYCVVVFRQALEVVMSPQLKHALEKIPHDNVPVVAGRNFTQQAYDAVQQANGVYPSRLPLPTGSRRIPPENLLIQTNTKRETGI